MLHGNGFERDSSLRLATHRNHILYTIKDPTSIFHEKRGSPLLYVSAFTSIYVSSRYMTFVYLGLLVGSLSRPPPPQQLILLVTLSSSLLDVNSIQLLPNLFHLLCQYMDGTFNLRIYQLHLCKRTFCEYTIP